MALFDGYDDIDMAENAAKHPDTAPLILDFSHRGAFVASIAGMPVGQIEWTVEQDERGYSEDDDVAAQAKGDYNGYHLRVSSLAVDAAFRRRGIARALFEHFTAHADKHHGFINGPGSGWDPGKFTADGAAFYEAVTGNDAPVTRRISYGT